MAESTGANRRARSVTMSDVAAAAGVSLGTVSNALNHPERVTDELRTRVQRAIDSLGFVRNSAARSLAAGSSNTVGFVLVDLANSLFVDMARGAEVAAQAAGMYLVMANSDVSAGKQRTYLEHFNQEQVAGILATLVGGELDGLEGARRAGRPVVVLDTNTAIGDTCRVETDYELSGYLAAQHLLSLGRRRLAFAGGPVRMPAIGDRLRGAQRAVREAGAVLEHLDSAEIQADNGREIGERLRARDRADLPDGVVAAADLVALGLMQALVDVDIAFPDDIALIACDDNKSAYDSLIPISTIDLPGYQMGRSAMELLLEEIRSPETHTHRRVIIEPKLTARESTVGRTRSAPAFA